MVLLPLLPGPFPGVLEGVGENGGPAAETLLGDQISLPQGLLQQAGPPLLLVEADAPVGAIRRVGAVAVGVGIPNILIVCPPPILPLMEQAPCGQPMGKGCIA